MLMFSWQITFFPHWAAELVLTIASPTFSAPSLQNRLPNREHVTTLNDLVEWGFWHPSLLDCEPLKLGTKCSMSVSVPPCHLAPWRCPVKLVKFTGLAVPSQEAPLSTQGISSDVLKGLPALVCPLSSVLELLWAKPL